MGEQFQHSLYEFGPFCVDTRERVLLRDGKPVPLKPKVYETLLALVKKSGHVVDKDVLMRDVWPDAFVEENNLTGNIFVLRRALAEHRYIETVPRRGYRFTAEVREMQVEEVRVAGRSGVETDVLMNETRAKPIDSLAVLPFVNASCDPATEYLSDGITESVINGLSQLSGLKIMARNTVFRYKGRETDATDLKRDLGVRAVLLGRVLQFGEHLIIRTELVDTADGRQLWGEQYNRKPSDILAVQEEIAREISEQLRLRLTGEERRRLTKRYTENDEAYREYLKGRYFWNKRSAEGVRKAIEYFQQAIEKDPTYALAYVGLADSYASLAYYLTNPLPPREVMPKAKAAAMKSLEIDETLAEGHASLGAIKMYYDWDWPGAESELQHALQLNPSYALAHYWYGVYLTAMERFEEGFAELKLAQELDPLSPIINTGVGTSLYYQRRYDESIEEYRNVLETDPNFAPAHLHLGLAYVQEGMLREAIVEFERAVALSAGNSLMMASLAHAYAASGKRSKARTLLDALTDEANRNHVSSLDVALVYAAMGVKDQAFAWLEKAYAEKSGWLILIRVEPRLEPLRSDSRFADLLCRIGLVA
jgi:TolB-like protein/Flp pilus assembly protein TadD